MSVPEFLRYPPHVHDDVKNVGQFLVETVVGDGRVRCVRRLGGQSIIYRPPAVGRSGGWLGAIFGRLLDVLGHCFVGALDAIVRRQERWAGAWRQRLALSATAVTARQAGRVED